MEKEKKDSSLKLSLVAALIILTSIMLLFASNERRA
jgi:hypothetical protein